MLSANVSSVCHCGANQHGRKPKREQKKKEKGRTGPELCGGTGEGEGVGALSEEDGIDGGIGL